MTERIGTGADSGFSLMELLVAVAVLAIAAVTLLESQTQAIGITGQVQERTLASIVAENRLNETIARAEEPHAGSRTGREEQFGTGFLWRETVRILPQNEIAVIEVSVVAEEAPKQELASLTGYRRVPVK
ncbi:MAG: type II secretion system protein GspI [Alphaproteobacteria bacterium]|nr:MAG: type II secretion system protein GspI [Alphaproteobacteria bacterium]